MTSTQSTWEEGFDGLRVWVADHGRLPLTGDEAGGKRHLAWLKSQRRRHRERGLPARRVAALESIPGGLHELPADAGTVRQRELRDWAASHGCAPRFGSPEEAGLAAVLYSLRYRALRGTAGPAGIAILLGIPGAVTDAQRQRIEALAATRPGPVVPDTDADRTLDARWEKGFRGVAAWHATHGALPKRRSACPEEYSAANWLNVQRMQARNGNLFAGWDEKLRTIPGALEPRPRSYSDQHFLDGIAAFTAEHSRLPSWKDPAERNHAYHLGRYRTMVRSGAATAEIIAGMTAIPGALESMRTSRSPEQRLKELEDYVGAHGHFPTREHSRGLATWTRRVLSEDSTADPSVRAAVLRLRVATPTAPFAYFLQLLTAMEAYLAEHGHTPLAGEKPLRMNRQVFKNWLASPQADAATKERITALLEAPRAAHALRGAA